MSCPCALSLATPAALAAAAGSLARLRVVLVRSDALETLARVTHIVLDKTGTLTEGCVRLAICTTTDGTSRANALALAAAVDARSEHPLARALREAANSVAAEGETADRTAPVVSDFRQVTGEGAEGTVDGVRVRVGRPAYVANLAGPMPTGLQQVADDKGNCGSLAALGDEHGWRALFTFADPLRPGAARLIGELRRLGITPIVLSQILVDDQRENRGERDSGVSGTLLTELIQRGGDALYSLVRRGVGDVETNLNEMRDNVRRWIRTPADGARFDTSEITQTVHSAVERVLRVADLPTRGDLEALNKNLERLASALESFEARLAAVERPRDRAV